MNKNDNLKYQLTELATSDREDLDYPEIEVFYEDIGGCDGSATVCLIDLGRRALARIEELEFELDRINKAGEG
jgi:hypothetical protein